jgi:hypothetical protein
MGLDERGPEGSEAKGRKTHIKLYEAQTSCCYFSSITYMHIFSRDVRYVAMAKYVNVKRTTRSLPAFQQVGFQERFRRR